MPSVFSKSDKSGKTRRLFFNQIRDKFEGWRAGKARHRASREKNMTMDEWNKFYPRFNELHSYILNRMHKKIDYAKMDVNMPADRKSVV